MTSPVILRAAVASLPESAIRTLVDAFIARDASKVAAELEPVLVATGTTPSEPATVIDCDGDKWTRQPDGIYSTDAGPLPRTLEKVREEFGPLTLPGVTV